MSKKENNAGHIIQFQSVEQAYQYSKIYFSSASEEEREKFLESILSTTNGKTLRELGRSVQILDKDVWNKAKVDIMKDLVRESFVQNPEAMKSFMEKTKGKVITHRQDTSEWKTLFPQVLTELRNEFLSMEKEKVVSEGFEPKVFVTYYGSRHIPEDAFKVQISTSCPKGMEEDIDVFFKTVYPDYRTMVNPIHKGEIGEAEYSARYKEQVLEPNRKKIVESMNSMIEDAKEDGKNIFLFCYEKPGEFCHRYLLSNFLNENGIACQEIPVERQSYTKGKIPLYGEEDYVSSFVKEENEEPVSFVQSSSPSYQVRTKENAQAPDVDFTLAFAVDFTTSGEKCTAKVAGDSFFAIDLPLQRGGGLDCSSKAVKNVVDMIYEGLPEEFEHGTPCGFNIAGNGIYTLAKKGVTQEKIDLFVSLVGYGLQEKGVIIGSLRSGGQSGADESVYVLSNVLKVPAIINAPHDWKYRDIYNRDHSGSKEEFVKRFTDKNISALKKQVMSFYKDNKRLAQKSI